MKRFIILLHALYGMARPNQVLAIGLVFTLGVLIATATGEALPVASIIWGVAAGLFVSLSVHYANEYADFETDQLAERTPYSGGSGVLPAGGVSRSVALRAAWVTLVVGMATQVVAVLLGIHTWIAFAILTAIAIFGWMYSLPPLALAWNGWGELDNALLGGMVMPLYGYSVVAGTLTWLPVLATIPLTILVFLNLLAVTWPDRHADGTVGKNTLATRWEVSQLRTLYYSTATVLITLNAYLLLSEQLPTPVGIAALTISPLIIWGAARYSRIESPHPTVYAMVGMILAQVVSWGLVASGLLS